MPQLYVRHRLIFDAERMMKKSSHFFFPHCSVSFNLDPVGLAISSGKEMQSME